jgi:hypothetical protein
VRVLLDECVARPLASALSSFDVRTVRDMRWAGVKNGSLIDLAAEAGFQAIFTVDREFGATYRGPLPLGVVILVARTTNPERLGPFMKRVADALSKVREGEILKVNV